MTIQYVGTEIQGLSTDTKPVDAPIGKKFFETDTGSRFEFDGTDWIETPKTAKNITSTEVVNFANLTTQTQGAFLTGASGFIETGLLHILFPVTQDTTPGGIFFQDNGTRMFVVGTNNATVYEFDLTTAWQVDTAVDTGDIFVISEDTAPNGIFFKGDGTKMFVMGTTNNTVYEYDLSTPWSILTASYSGNSFLIPNSDEPDPLGVCLKSDGTQMFITGTAGKIIDYTLSTAFDLSDTVTFFQEKDVSAQDTSPSGLFFRSDGTKMYFSGIQNDSVYEYNLTTPWDVTSAVIFETVSISDIISTENAPHGLFIKPDAAKMYVVGTDTATVYELHLGILIDGKIIADEGEFDSVKVLENTEHFDGSTQEMASSPVPFVGCLNTSILQSSQTLPGTTTTPSGVYWKPDGTRFYITDRDTNELQDYSLDGGIPWDISGGITEATTDGITSTTEDLFIRSDGLVLYTIDRGGGTNDVNQYTVTTPWDFSSLPSPVVVDLDGETANQVRGIHFKSDGKVMYVASVDDVISQYSLAIPWDITTLGTREAVALDANSDPLTIRFNQEGTRMYITSSAEKSMRRYDVSVPWDITSTLTLIDTFVIPDMVGSPSSLYIKPNSDRIFTLDTDPDDIISFDLGIKTGGIVEAPLRLPYRTSASTTETFNLTDSHVALSNTAVRTITLSSDLIQNIGRLYVISDSSDNAGTNNITIDTQGSETINGAASVTINADGGAFRFYSDGTNFHEW